MPKDANTSKSPRWQPNNNANAESRTREYQSRPRNAINWDDIPQDRIGLLVHAVATKGAAIMFGRTSDGGALSITVLDGDNRVREWPHSIEDFDSVYKWLVAMFDTV